MHVRERHIMPVCNKILTKSNNEKVKSKKDLLLKKDPESLKKYKKQKNVCSRNFFLYQKERKMFFSNLALSKIWDNKTFWKTSNIFREKQQIANKITLIHEDETVISYNQLISKEFNSFIKRYLKPWIYWKTHTW